jgi:hypothetical protein
MPTLPARDGNVVLAPHTVILGAGASIAAYIDWGKTGPALPSMQDLIDVLTLREEVTKAGYDPNTVGFEALYDELATSKKNEQLRRLIENRTVEYFSSLSLPDKPTIYDYLVLSLREKDLIATFNWDPFLLQACLRNQAVTSRRPRIAFLHGNVKVGSCNKDRVSGVLGHWCPQCGKEFKPSKLLYPVKQKNYSDDAFIKNEWDLLRAALRDSYYLTIFGYSAPVTDVEARKAMLEDWSGNPALPLNQVEIIDVRPADELEATWKDFFVRDHYSFISRLSGSQLSRHPRRSCEAFAAATLMNRPWFDNNVPQFDKLSDFHAWISPLIVEEDRYARESAQFSGTPLPPNKK